MEKCIEYDLNKQKVSRQSPRHIRPDVIQYSSMSLYTPKLSNQNAVYIGYSVLIGRFLTTSIFNVLY